MTSGEAIEGSKHSLLKMISLVIVLFCVPVLLEYRTKIRLKGIHGVCLLWVFIMPIVVYINRGLNSDYIFTLLWPLFFEISYVMISSKNKRMKIFVRFFLVVFCVGFYLFIGAISAADGKQSNAIFFPLLTLPWLACIERKYLRVLLLGVLTIAVLFSMKRSSIIVRSLVWVIYGCLAIRNERRKMVALLTVVILFVVGFFAFDIIDERTGGMITERLNREETNEGRNRLAIYEIVGEMQMNSSKLAWVLGHGHNGVWKNSPLEISAHNDIQEVLYDYGLIIMVLYLCLWWYVIKRSIYLYRIKSPYLFPYLSSLAIFVVMSLVSHLILYTSYFNFLVIFWGCIEGMIYVERRMKFVRMMQDREQKK